MTLGTASTDTYDDRLASIPTEQTEIRHLIQLRSGFCSALYFVVLSATTGREWPWQ